MTASWWSNLEAKFKVESIVFALLLFFLPTQLSYHLWPLFSYVLGLRIDYLSPTLYLSDILIFILVITSFKRLVLSLKTLIKYIGGKKHLQLFLGVFLSLIIFSTVLSQEPAVGLYGLSRYLQAIFVGWYTLLFLKNGKYKKQIFVSSLFLGMIVQSFLGTSQFLFQHSLNGLWYWLGERTFSLTTPGIARSSIEGRLILRPYGTLPHPNVLAGYLLLGQLITLSFWSFLNTIQKRIVLFFSPVIVLCLFLSLSRIVVFLFIANFFLLTWFYLSKKPSKKAVVLLIAGFLLVFIFLLQTSLLPRFTNFSFSELSFRERVVLNNQASKIIIDNPLFGVGTREFIPTLPQYKDGTSKVLLQPVHNVYLLIASENGVIVLGVVLLLLVVIGRKISSKSFFPIFISLAFFSFLVISIFDHYFLTTHQGLLVSGLLFGAIIFFLSNKTRV